MEEKIGSYNAIKIGLFGGEPLLKGNYKIVERVLEFAKKMPYLTHIETRNVILNYKNNALYVHQLSKLCRKLVGTTVHYIAGNHFGSLFFISEESPLK